MKIKRNAVKCKICGNVIESKHTWDYVICDCGQVGVDGGKDYLKRIGRSENMEELSEYFDESSS